MPNVFRYPLDELLGEIEEAMELGIRAIALFPVIQQEHKTLMAEESYNPSALTQKTIRAIKKRFPELILISDIALDPYTSHGHDGLIKDGKILNDETVAVLCKMALAQAEAGADIVAPSDMMDGRIGAIRSALDAQNFFDTKIMAYTAKYKSSLYAPFRDALGSLGHRLHKITEHHHDRPVRITAAHGRNHPIEQLIDRTVDHDHRILRNQPGELLLHQPTSAAAGRSVEYNAAPVDQAGPHQFRQDRRKERPHQPTEQLQRLTVTVDRRCVRQVNRLQTPAL